MSDDIKSQSYDELYAGLIRAKEWFESIGITISGSRFELIVNNVNLACQYYNNSSLNDLVQEHPTHELFISLLDASSFIIIVEQLQKLRSDQLPRKSLKESILGPLMPHDENSDGVTIQARNALFELEFASRIQERGVSLISFDDITFEFEGVEVNIQCKRPRSNRSLQQNLGKACSQINKRIEGTNSKGIIAIGLDKLLESDRTIWSVDNKKLLLHETRNILKNIVEENKFKFNNILNINILCVIVDLRYIAIIKDQGNLLTRGYETMLYPLASSNNCQLSDADFLDRFMNKMLKN